MSDLSLSKQNRSGFRHLSLEDRWICLQEECGLTQEELKILKGDQPVSLSHLEQWIENGIGYFSLPLGVANHFVIDGTPRLIPMAIEETSVIAAASGTAKWICSRGPEGGDIQTETLGSLIIGQIQLPAIQGDPKRVRALLDEHEASLIQRAHTHLSSLVKRGGGVQQIICRELLRPDGKTMLVLHLLCDPCDAMGANLITQTCEVLKPFIEQLTGEKVGLCILSNLVDSKLVRVRIQVREVEPGIAEGIQEASLFASLDPYRAATHNKGIFNGIDAVLMATGNDWRAVEAGAHAYAALQKRGTDVLSPYGPLSVWKREGKNLVGELQLPLAVGTVGGLTLTHPMARLALKILGISRAEELARIVAAVGLVQNLGALRALSTVGVVQGHMKLHAANLALAAGAEGSEIQELERCLIHLLKTEKTIQASQAKSLLEKIRVTRSEHPQLPR